MLGKSHIPSPVRLCLGCSVMSVGWGISMGKNRTSRVPEHTVSLNTYIARWLLQSFPQRQLNTLCLGTGGKVQIGLSPISRSIAPVHDGQVTSQGITTPATRLQVGKRLPSAESPREHRGGCPATQQETSERSQPYLTSPCCSCLFRAPSEGTKGSSYQQIGNRGGGVGGSWGAGDGKKGQ